MRKFTYLAAVAILAVSTLTACGTKKADTTPVENKTEVVAGNNGEATPTAEPTAKAVEEKATDVVIEHSLGTVTVPVNPKKAVVFDFGMLDTIAELGVDTELAVAVSSLPEYLNQYSSNTGVGTIKEPDLEAIFEFEPEVIIISGRQSSYYDQLSEIAPTVYVELNSETYMEDFEKNVNIAAQIFGKEDIVADKIAEIKQQAVDVKAIADTKEEKALILLTNDGSISAYGKGSRFGIIHDLLGVKAADENIEASTHGQEANYEYISKVNPDIIFVVDRTEVGGGVGDADVVLDNELVNGTNAAKNDRIVALDPDVWYVSGGGLQSVTEMIKVVGEAINK